MNNDSDDMIERLLSLIVSKTFKKSKLNEACFSILELCERQLLAGILDLPLWLTNTLSKLSLAGVSKASLAEFARVVEAYLKDPNLPTITASERRRKRTVASKVMTNCLRPPTTNIFANAEPALKWFAIAAVTGAATAFLYMFITKPVPPPAYCSPTSTVYYGKRYVSLPDKSSVIVAEGGEVCYDPSYGHKDRRVYLSGEAYFQVAPDATKLFYVDVGGVMITVKGTGFNVKDGNGKVIVSVATGKVDVSYRDDHHDVLPGYELSIRKHDNEIHLERFDSSKVTWPYPLLVYNTPTRLDSVFKDLEKHFHIHILCASSVPQDCQLVGAYNFKTADVFSIFKTLESGYSIKYKVKNDTVLVTGGKCYDKPIKKK